MPCAVTASRPSGKTVDIDKLKGPQTQVVDLGGHFVMPGFNDAHLHLDDAGMTKLSVDLTGVKSLDELRAQVAKKVDESKAGDWILGSGWDETLWPVKVTPTRWDLDEVSGGHPVFLVRIDGHIAVANTRALQLGSITLASRESAGRSDRSQREWRAHGNSAGDGAGRDRGSNSQADTPSPPSGA